MISEQKSDERFTLRGKFTSIRVIHICYFETCEAPWSCRTEPWVPEEFTPNKIGQNLG